MCAEKVKKNYIYINHRDAVCHVIKRHHGNFKVVHLHNVHIKKLMQDRQQEYSRRLCERVIANEQLYIIIIIFYKPHLQLLKFYNTLHKV